MRGTHRAMREVLQSWSSALPVAVACALGLGLATTAASCQRAPEHTLVNRTVTVACARCVFHLPGVQGCPWAVEIEGKHYFVQGAIPLNYDSHARDGICNMPRKAVVDGVIRGERFVASRLQLLPAENVPEHPTYSTADKH
jgi:hypothetical protein